MTSFSPFTSYTGTVKERIEDLELGPLTVIIGDEASYKSAIGIGVRLALTGEFEPIGKQPSELLSLAADKSVGIDVHLSGPDGSARWKLRVDEDGKAKKPVPPAFSGKLEALDDDDRYAIIPMNSVRDLLKNAKGDRKLREAFLHRFGGGLKEMPKPFMLDEAEQTLWDISVEKIKASLPEGSTADSLLAELSSYFRTESGALKRKITPIEQHLRQAKIDLQKQEMEEGVSLELMEETEAKLTRARKFEMSAEDVKRKTDLTADISNVEAEIKTCAEQISTAKSSYDKELSLAETAREEAQKKKAEALQNLRQIERMLVTAEVLANEYALAIEKGKSKCLFCGNPREPERMLSTQKDFEGRANARRGAVANAEQALDDADQAVFDAIAKVNEVKRQYERQSSTLETVAASLRRRLVEATQQLKEIEGRLAGAPVAYKGPSSKELEEKLTKLRRAAQVRKELSEKGNELRLIEKKYNQLKKLENEAMEMQKTVMKRVATIASEEISIGMTGGRSARFDPVTYDFYLTRPDGKEFGPFGALCGTERTSLMLGLMAAWTRGAPVRIPILDDEEQVGLHRKGVIDLRKQLEFLLNRGDFTQVILISNRPEVWVDEKGQKLEDAKNWTVIVRRAMT